MNARTSRGQAWATALTGAGPGREGVTVTAVELTGAYPDTCLVFRFHFPSQPECAFAWHGQLWDPTVSEDLNPDPWSNIEVYFMEDLGTRRARWLRDCRAGVTMNVGQLRSNGAFVRAEHERPRKPRRFRVQFEQVVGGVDQPPFRPHGGSPSSLEAVDLAVVFLISEHRLDHHRPAVVEPAPGLVRQDGAHPRVRTMAPPFNRNRVVLAR